jgi:OPT oligopeptide transporter protein
MATSEDQDQQTNPDAHREEMVEMNTLRHRNKFYGGNDENEETQVLSVEQVFETKTVPSWKKQLTVRAFVVAFFLAVMFSVIVMKLNLTTGIIPSLNVSAGLLGFFFLRMWTGLLDKCGMLKQPFTRQENTVVQTAVVAAYGLAFSGMLTYIFHFLLYILIILS